MHGFAGAGRLTVGTANHMILYFVLAPMFPAMLLRRFRREMACR
jgi:hypothetical protein